MGRRRMGSLRGTGVALITPFLENGKIDFPALEKLVSHNVENGVNYLVVLGTTGESATLTKQEKQDVIATVKQVNAGRLPIVLGIGGNNTSAIIEDYKSTDLNDFEAVLTVSPYYNKPTQEGIYQHYKAIAEQTDQHIILYNVPGRTSSNIEVETVVRLATDFENIVAIKEASPSFVQAMDHVRLAPENFLVLSGDDDFGVPLSLAGGNGIISVIGQALPYEYSKMIQYALDKNVEEAFKIHYKLAELTYSIYDEGNPAGIKQLLNIIGICKPYTRLPLVPASNNLKEKIVSLYEQILTPAS